MAVLAEILTSVVTGLSAVLVALVTALGHRLTKINRQVSNSHGSNLRDDVDLIKAGVDQVITEQHRHTGELAALRLDVITERQERGALNERVAKVEDDLYR